MNSVEAFKNEMSNYQYYVCKVKELELDLDSLWYELTGVKGVRFDKELGNGSFNESLAECRRLDLLEQISRKEEEISRISQQITYISSMVNKLPENKTDNIRQACIEIYINKKHYEQVVKEKDVFYTEGGLFKAIDRELKKIL